MQANPSVSKNLDGRLSFWMDDDKAKVRVCEIPRVFQISRQPTFMEQ
jgi:hypothetical protein